MEFQKLIRNRYSCRDYANTPLKHEEVDLILEAGRLAPSAVNNQPWHFIILNTPTSLEKVHQAYNREWFKKAPVVIVICGDNQASWKRRDGKDHMDIDIAIATDHMTLQAAELNIGSCWVCNFDAASCKKSLELPDNVEPLVFLPLGYPLDKAEDSVKHNSRKSLNDIVHYAHF